MDPRQAGVLPVRSADEFDALRAEWARRPVEPLFTTREGRPVVQAPGGPIYILLRGEETGGAVGFYDQVSAVGAAIGAHHQTSEDETFYVLEGRWKFRAGGDERVVGPGALIHAPRGVTHAFEAVAGEGGVARLLSWNAPAGHERFYVGMGDAKAQGLNPRVDAAPHYHTTFGGPAMATEARAVFATRDDAPRTAERGIGTALLLDPADSAGRSAVREIDAAPGATMVLSDETAHCFVFVAAGDWRVALGDRTRPVGPDTMVQLPAGIAASAEVTGSTAGRLLVVTLPLG